jgi:hypothetical protein
LREEIQSLTAAVEKRSAWRLIEARQMGSTPATEFVMRCRLLRRAR